MEEEASASPSPQPPSPSLSSSPSPASSVAWSTYISEELPRSVQQSTDSAIRSARSLQHSSSTYLHALKDFIPQIGPQYRSYEEAFFHRIKDELVTVKEHPGLAGGVALATGLLLMRGPRRFLFRQTLGRLQSEEAQFNKAEKKVKDMLLSVDLLKKESNKLLERSTLAEKDMMRGYSNIKNAGTQIQSIARSVHKAEAKASDLMDMLRLIPSREALKLRADVASMASNLRQQGKSLDKRVMKISDLGVSV